MKKYTFQQESSDFELNIAELFGLKKLNSDGLLYFLINELCRSKPVIGKNQLMLYYGFTVLVVLFVIVLRKIVRVYLKFKYYPQEIPSFIFPDITYAQINNGTPEYLKYLANDGFLLFGLEVNEYFFKYLSTRSELC